MKNIFVFALFLAIPVTFAIGQIEEIEEMEEEAIPVEPETLTVELFFKDINVVEYDLDLVFMDEDSNDVWFSEINADLSEMELYTMEDMDGMPMYTVNEAKVGKKYKVYYREIVIEGDMSGEPQQVNEVLGIEEISQN